MLHQRVSLLILLTAVLLGQACAPLQPTSATGPRGNEPPYPVVMPEDSHRIDTTIAAITHLTNADVTKPPTAVLEPITATINGWPANSPPVLYLPKVGANPVMNEEETRESLRRFIKLWQVPIGADPAKLSLVERVDLPDGTMRAKYEQRAFRYPIRGNYGWLDIHFTSDRRVLDITSSCIPDADKIQTALSAVPIKLKAEDAIKQLTTNDVQKPISYGTLTYKLSANNKLEPHELVTYITTAEGQAKALDFHVAWEIGVTNAPISLVYVDAVSGETIEAQ